MIRRLYQRCLPLFINRGFRVLLFLNVLLGLAYSFVSPFMSMFGTSRDKGAGMTPLHFGLFMTITALGGVVIGTVLAHYSDTHFSRRRMLLWGSVAGMLGYLGYAFVRDFYPLLFIGTFVLGISSITFSQLFAHAREAILKSGIPAKEMPFYTNAFRMFFALSWTVGPAIASWVMVAFSFKGLFLCSACCFLMLFVAVWMYVPEAPPPGDKNARAESMFKVLGRFDVLVHFVGFVLVFASATIGMANLPLLVMQTLGGTERDVGVIYTIAPVFELPFMLYVGMLATRCSQAGIIRAGVAILVFYYGLLCLVQAPWHIYPLQVLAAAATAVTSGVAITYFQNYLPDHPGSATNLYSNAMRIGGLLGYLLFGTIAETFGYRAVFMACGIFIVIAFALLQVPVKTVGKAETSAAA